MAGPIDLTRMYCSQQDGTIDQERSYYLHNFDGGRMEWRILGAGTLEFTDSDSGVVVLLYDTKYLIHCRLLVAWLSRQFQQPLQW
jgi:hypothetical protein